MTFARIVLLLFLSGASAQAADNTPQLMLDTGGHMAIIKGLAFTRDGNHIISGGDDKVVRIWDWRAGKTVRTIRGQIGPGLEGKIYALALSPDERWLAVGGWMGHYRKSEVDDESNWIRLYDFASGRLTALLKGHTRLALSLAFSPDSKKLISGGFDSTAIIWDIDRREPVRRLQGHRGDILSVAFAPDGQRVVTGSEDKTLRLWQVDDGKLIAEMPGHKGSKITLAVRSSDAMIASGDDYGEIRLWNGNTGQFLRTLADQGSWIGKLVFLPDGNSLLSTCAQDCKERKRGLVWDIGSGREIIAHKGHDNIVVAAGVSADGRFVATGSFYGDVQVWDPTTGETHKILAGVGRSVWATGVSPDGRRIGWGSTFKSDGFQYRGVPEMQLRLPGASSGQARPERIEEVDAKSFVRARPTYGSFALNHRESAASRWSEAVLDIKKDGRTVVSIERDLTNGSRHRAYSFSADGRLIVSGGSFGVLSAYDLGGKHLGDFIGHESDMWAVTPSPDGRLLVTGSADQTIRLWNITTRELIATLFHGTDGEWVLWTPQGYYSSSPGGEKIVGWQINRGIDQAAEYVAASQLRAHFYRPDIVERAIVLASAKAAVEQARGTAFSLAELRTSKPPDFSIVAPTNRSSAGASPAEIRIKFAPNADPLEKIEAFVNGRQTTPQALLNATPRSAALEIPNGRIQLPLEQGENKIRIVAHNRIGQTVREFVLFHDRPGQLDRRGKLYVLAIGIDKYPHLPPICGAKFNETCDLKFAGKDARRFRDVLTREGKPLYRDIETLLLTQDGDKAPTKTNIETALTQFFGQAGPEDTAVLFIAGHGALDGENGGYLFMPEGAERSSKGWNTSTMISWSTFRSALRNIRGQRIMFADTCHAGGAYNSRLINDAADANVVVFAATDSKTVSLELPALAHGAFTYALVRGLEGMARMGDGTVTLLGLGAFVSKEVASLTGNRQQPTFHFTEARDYTLVATPESAQRLTASREAALQEAIARNVPTNVSNDLRDPNFVDMLFATSRKADVSASSIVFTRERAEALSFGSLRVRIPGSHKIGRIELPTTRNFILYTYQQTADEQQHFVMRDITFLDQEAFVQKVKSAGRQEALVFVHGFNNTFEEAAFRLAQIAFDMKYKGLPVLFSWAAASGVSGYRHDIDSARLARDLFVELLQVLQKNAEIKTVHIVAHSMGNALVMEALDRVAGEKLPLNIAELIMAAPDVSRDLFKQIFGRISALPRGVTLYASSKDRALVASKTLALDIPRAGDVPKEGPITLPRLDTIDVSAFGEEFLGLNHSTFASNRSLIDDIGRLINDGKRPPGARTPQLQGSPRTVNPPLWWSYPE